MKTAEIIVVAIVIIAGMTNGSNPNMIQGAGGCDCPSKHPQQKFCDESLVIKGTIIEIGRPQTRGQIGTLNMDMMIEVYVKEVFKTNDRSIRVGSTVYLHTYGTCRFDKMLRVGQDYVLSGNDVYQQGYYVILRGCSMVQKWSTLNRDQINGLREDYQDCLFCEITKTKVTYNIFDEYSFLEPPLEDNNDQPIGSCFHNQQIAFTTGKYKDCESLYSACVVRNESCEWSESREYRKCMKKRSKEVKKGKKGKMNGKGGKNKSGKGKGKGQTTG